jgi:DNA replication protein DnaC
MTSLSKDQKSKCPHCGKEIPFTTFEAMGRTFSVPVACECMVKRYEREEAERLQQEKAARVEKLFNMTRIGERLKAATFDTWEDRPEPSIKLAHTTALRFVAQWDSCRASGRGILFYGDPGTGKSHMAAAILHALLPKGTITVYQSVPDLLQRIRNTYDKANNEREDELMRSLEESELLILDDLGAEQMTDWVRDRIYRIIDSRYRNQRPLIITSNLTLDQIGEQFTDRIADRLIEMCRVIEVKGESYRKLRAKGHKN